MTKPASDFTRMPRPSRGASLIGRKDWPISPSTRSTWRLIRRVRRFTEVMPENRRCLTSSSTRWWFKYGDTKALREPDRGCSQGAAELSRRSWFQAGPRGSRTHRFARYGPLAGHENIPHLTHRRIPASVKGAPGVWYWNKSEALFVRIPLERREAHD